MNIDPSDVKFGLAYFGAALTFWRTSAWVTRKQIVYEGFLDDIRAFMKQTTASVHRIETNHLAHQEKYLKAIAKANGVEFEDDFDAPTE